MLIALLIGTGIGSVYSMDGIRNTSIVYWVLWSVEKYFEIYFIYSDSVWVFLFTMFVGIYYLSL